MSLSLAVPDWRLRDHALKTASSRVDITPSALTDSAQAVLRMISRSGPMTRPQLSAALAFSKPTMSAAVGELEAFGLVRSSGLAKGAMGRTAVTYDLGPNVGFIVGIDCGTTQVRAAASKLDGNCFAELQQTVGDGQGPDLADELIERAPQRLQRRGLAEIGDRAPEPLAGRSPTGI